MRKFKITNETIKVEMCRLITFFSIDKPQKQLKMKS